MNSCPRCGKTYPDAERFCESDGTALVAAGGAGSRETAVMPEDYESAGAPIVCPECHGKAEPGETICNFCGTQLLPDATAPAGGYSPSYPAPSSPASSQASSGSSRTAASPENFIPSQNRIGTSQMNGDPDYPDYDAPVEEQSLRERVTRVLGYSIAAIIAVAGGVWFALHLSGGRTPAPVAVSSPAVSGPIVALASNMQIDVNGADVSATSHRDRDSARAVFDTNRDAVLDTYKQALERDSTLRDGMVVRLHVLPDGTVSGGTVVVSTSPNPSLDAEVVKNLSDWKFAPSSGSPVDVEYPMIFATASGDVGNLESDLNSKFASLGPNETPEYASSPMVEPTPPVAVATPEAAPTPPPVAALPPPEAPAITAPPRRARPPRPARVTPPPPSITDRVVEALSMDKRLRRVQAYSSPGGTVTLSGKVFDDKAKTAAERTVRNVSGVTGVIDNLTTDTSVWARNEDLINQRLQAEGLTGVSVKVIGDGAYLDGTVKTDLDRQRAETIAISAAPVKIRTNLIRVETGSIF
jgi:osmotically-inducible protein OsmY